MPCIAISSKTHMIDTEKLAIYKNNILNDLLQKLAFINIVFVYSNVGKNEKS